MSYHGQGLYDTPNVLDSKQTSEVISDINFVMLLFDLGFGIIIDFGVSREKAS